MKVLNDVQELALHTLQKHFVGVLCARDLDLVRIMNSTRLISISNYQHFFVGLSPYFIISFAF